MNSDKIKQKIARLSIKGEKRKSAKRKESIARRLLALEKQLTKKGEE
jgi:hypothetical protein